ncbi:Prenyltransferase and squalene oxidase repeat protein [Rubripirellula amarantea]|uniref:Prenyltransferase and squalene oxidase repeat protein n=2 Tax=Rubripirellula amarantea TaxID=2527999 RepID=A0A5C5WVE1_9BACT|nr:Prenyltransferase and squalene oxidase repeat protein [Rubripirellula amarantea]
MNLLQSFARKRQVVRSRMTHCAYFSGIDYPSDCGRQQAVQRLGALFAVIFAVYAACLPQTAIADIDAATVQRSIDRGVAYLRKIQNESGGWEEATGQSCGRSALCTLALINCGVDRQDPDLARAMRYLRTFEPEQTYSVALQTLVYCQMGAAGDLPRIRRNVQWLVETQLEEGGRPGIDPGSWTYDRNRGSGDPSNSQFAILALGAAADRGIQVDPKTFETALKYWSERQTPSGGWFYRRNQSISGSMTCAGISSLIIARGRLGGSSSQINGNTIRCCGNILSEADPVEMGLGWLAKNFTVQTNPGSNKQTHYYYLYALERVGRLSGRRFIGGHDWYREGAELIVSLQDNFQGNWLSTGPLEPTDVATSFALLFLSKGKRQVVAGRLRYANAQPTDLDKTWQRHPDGLRQLVHRVESDWGRDLTWQTIESENATLADLLQTPVLVISGNRPLAFSAYLVEQLSGYIEQGGTILFEADAGDGCGPSGPFARSVQELCGRLVEGGSLERLPPAHPVWFAQTKVDPTAISDDFWMYGVQACCRTSIFFSPRSLSCRWELGDVITRRKETSPSVQQQVETALGIGENVIAYATGRELKDKLDQRFVIRGGEVPKPNRGATQLASLAIDAGGQEARRALPNAVSLIDARVPISISSPPKPVDFDSEQLQNVGVLWLHGRTDFTLDANQRAVLKEYIENGGVILAASVCGADEFATAFRRELKTLLPESPLEIVSSDHPIIRVPGGFDLGRVTIRTPSARGDSVAKRSGIPRLEVAQVNRVDAVFFSPLDLSCALESPNSIQCPGYDTEDSAKIVANLLLLVHQQ